MSCQQCQNARKALRSGMIACKFWTEYRDGSALPEKNPFTGEFQGDLETYGPETSRLGWAKLDVTPDAPKGEGTMVKDRVLVPADDICFAFNSAAALSVAA